MMSSSDSYIEDIVGTLRSHVLDGEYFAEGKTVSSWWDKLPGKRRQRVIDILGLGKGKDKRLYQKLDADEQDEIASYYSKHKGKVEDVGLDEGSRPLKNIVLSLAVTIEEMETDPDYVHRKDVKVSPYIDNVAGAIKELRSFKEVPSDVFSALALNKNKMKAAADKKRGTVPNTVFKSVISALKKQHGKLESLLKK
jgi:hypothetical protein